jgi:hypothetical protein
MGSGGVYGTPPRGPELAAEARCVAARVDNGYYPHEQPSVPSLPCNHVLNIDIVQVWSAC